MSPKQSILSEYAEPIHIRWSVKPNGTVISNDKALVHDSSELLNFFSSDISIPLSSIVISGTTISSAKFGGCIRLDKLIDKPKLFCAKEDMSVQDVLGEYALQSGPKVIDLSLQLVWNFDQVLRDISVFIKSFSEVKDVSVKLVAERRKVKVYDSSWVSRMAESSYFRLLSLGTCTWWLCFPLYLSRRSDFSKLIFANSTLKCSEAQFIKANLNNLEMMIQDEEYVEWYVDP